MIRIESRRCGPIVIAWNVDGWQQVTVAWALTHERAQNKVLKLVTKEDA